jgi:hypothetical protein
MENTMKQDDSTPIDGTRPNTTYGGLVHDGYPSNSVNDMKQMIADNNKAMEASGERALTQPEYLAAVARGEHPLTAVDWWQLRQNNSSYHVSLHLKQDKLHEAHTK